MAIPALGCITTMFSHPDVCWMLGGKVNEAEAQLSRADPKAGPARN